MNLLNINTKQDLEDIATSLRSYSICPTDFVSDAVRDYCNNIIREENKLNLEVDESQLRNRFEGDFVGFRKTIKEFFAGKTVKDKIVELMRSLSYESNFYHIGSYDKLPKYVRELIDADGRFEKRDTNPSIVNFYDLQVVFTAKDFYKVRELLKCVGVKFSFPTYYHEKEEHLYSDESGNNIAFLEDGKITIKGSIVPMLNVMFRKKYEIMKGTIIRQIYMKSV